MSLFKSELKMLVTHEIGVRVDDSLEAAKKDLNILEGRQAAFIDGSKAVEGLLGHVDKDIEDGKLELPVAGEIKKYILRASNALQNLSVQAANFRMAQTGKVHGIEQIVTLLKNMVDAERDKVDALKVAGTAPAEAGDRPAGVAPAGSIKEQRLAEEAAEAQEASKAPEVPQEPKVEEPPAPELKAVDSPPESNGFKKQGKKSHVSDSR